MCYPRTELVEYQHPIRDYMNIICSSPGNVSRWSLPYHPSQQQNWSHHDHFPLSREPSHGSFFYSRVRETQAVQGQCSAEPAGGAPIARKSVQQNKSYVCGTKFPLHYNIKHIWHTQKRAFGIAGKSVWALLLQKPRQMQYFSCF